jgi:hypothetical protein
MSLQHTVRAVAPSGEAEGGRRVPAGRSRPAACSCSLGSLSAWRPPSCARPRPQPRTVPLQYGVQALRTCELGHTFGDLFNTGEFGTRFSLRPRAIRSQLGLDPIVAARTRPVSLPTQRERPLLGPKGPVGTWADRISARERSRAARSGRLRRRAPVSPAAPSIRFNNNAGWGRCAV